MKKRHLPTRGDNRDSANCRGAPRQAADDVMADFKCRPGLFEVVRHVWAAFFCRSCGAAVQAPMRAMPLKRGWLRPGLQAHVPVSG